ncbi:hypothetical protein PVAG01_08057 [Phlyctema vagabunda]|uniref:Actin-like ATPase domain-containing protein n=1 Tax=Phlyctema vagabunda TaxID=108571 RepID=A0ABR4P8B8_9HELO
MEAIFLIDFGMTASTAECLVTYDNFQSLKHHKFSKMPTRVVYGQKHNILGWGDTDSYGENAETRILFKSSINHTEPMQEDLKAISDYLRCFCSYVIDEVLQKEDVSKDQVRVTWHLTTPGCWTDSSRRNFHLLAIEVLDNITPGCEVTADLTESVASCEFLVDHLQLPYGTCIMTCDIGGSTCDMAFAVIRRSYPPNKRPDDIVKKLDRVGLFPEVYPIGFSKSPQANVTKLDNLLAGHLSKHRRDRPGPDLSTLIAAFVASEDWKHARHTFAPSSDITLPIGSGFMQESRPDGTLSIIGTKLLIPSGTMESLIKKFLRRLFIQIDTALADWATKTRGSKFNPSIIALCGGGGTMAWPLKNLENRYPGLKIEYLSSTKESCLVTVSGHRISRLRSIKDRIINQYLGDISFGLSNRLSWIKAPRIDWRESPERYATFECESPARDNKSVHHFIVREKTCSVPDTESLSELLEQSGFKEGLSVWSLTAALDPSLIHKHKYRIEVICTGRGEFKFMAYTQTAELSLRSSKHAL